MCGIESDARLITKTSIRATLPDEALFISDTIVAFTVEPRNRDKLFFAAFCSSIVSLPSICTNRGNSALSPNSPIAAIAATRTESSLLVFNSVNTSGFALASPLEANALSNPT